MARLFRILHERDEKRSRPHVQNAFDRYRIVPGATHDRLNRAPRHRLQLGQ
jgi:hypothetical protein